MVPALAVEEEHLLLDPRSGRPVDLAADVLATAASSSGAGDVYDCRPGLATSQVEVATPACGDLDELAASLRGARGDLGAAAARAGVLLSPVGTAPDHRSARVGPTEGDLRLLDGVAGQEQLVCGMRVHVEVPGRDAGITVLNRLRPVLPVVVALTGNSPLWAGEDTGFSSWRTAQARCWGVESPPPRFRDAAHYQRHLDWLTTTGLATDRVRVPWSMRLAERSPTVEVRVADVQLGVEEAVMVTALLRACVVRALADAGDGVPEPRVRTEVVGAACWHAARHGVDSGLVALDGGAAGPALRPGGEVVEALVERLAATDRACARDVERVWPTVSSVLHGGGGAARQRMAFAEGGLPGWSALVGLAVG